MSDRRDGSSVKRERLQKMHRMLKGVGDVNLDRFLAACSYTLGLTHGTALKYLKDLAMLGLVELDEEEKVVREVVMA